MLMKHFVKSYVYIIIFEMLLHKTGQSIYQHHYLFCALTFEKITCSKMFIKKWTLTKSYFYQQKGLELCMDGLTTPKPDPQSDAIYSSETNTKKSLSRAFKCL